MVHWWMRLCLYLTGVSGAALGRQNDKNNSARNIRKTTQLDFTATSNKSNLIMIQHIIINK